MHRGDLQYGRNRATFHAAYQLLSDKSVAELLALKQTTDLELAERAAAQAAAGASDEVDAENGAEQEEDMVIAAPRERLEVAGNHDDEAEVEPRRSSAFSGFSAFATEGFMMSTKAAGASTSGASGFAKYQGKNVLAVFSQPVVDPSSKNGGNATGPARDEEGSDSDSGSEA